MNDNVFPVIPAKEFPARWSRVLGLMEEHRLDLVIAYGDDRAVFGPAHLRWLANFPVHFEPALFVMAPSGKPMLICGPESPGYARQTGQVADIRIMEEFTHPDEDYPFSKIQPFSEIIADMAGGLGKIRRVGLAGGGLIGSSTLSALKDSLPNAEWIDIEAAMCGLRSVKTPAEIAVIRHAYKIAHAAIMAGIEAVKPGVTEREINAAVDAALWRDGGEGPGIATTITSGRGSSVILGRSSFRRIENNDLVMLTVAPRYEGYHAAIGRPVFVGNPGAEAVRARTAARRAAEACFELLRPGAEGRAVEGEGRRIMAEAGFGENFLYSGVHSIGVIEFEPPIFGPSAQGRLAANMCISVDIPVFNAPWGGLRFEDGYLITASGAERLQQTDMDFQR